MDRSKPFSILYVEDDPAHALFTTLSFKRSCCVGYEITHLTDGQQALDYLYHRGKYSDIESSPNPDLILLDLRLPIVDGFEVLKTIKSDENLRSIPIIILTTSDSETDKEKAYRYYANSYLVKPLNASKFSHMIESFGSYWMEWNNYSLQR